jgi:hypothetical protein
VDHRNVQGSETNLTKTKLPPLEHQGEQVLKSVEELLNQITENCAVVESAMYDNAMLIEATNGIQRLMRENIVAVDQIRVTLPSGSLVLEVSEEQHDTQQMDQPE